jgi:Tol biopolymer transport system component
MLILETALSTFRDDRSNRANILMGTLMNYKLGVFKLLTGCLVSLLILPHITLSGASAGRMESVSVSPDGKFIAVDFIKGDTSFIYRIAVDTGNATRLTDAKTGHESRLAFSPDGRLIAYSYSPGNGEGSRIVIGSIDGSNLHTWSPSKVRDFSPVFSPDNKTIVFARSGYYGSYSPIAQPHHHAWDFYAADLDGANVRQLTHESFYKASTLSLSPDGRNMVVVTEGVDTPEQIAIYSLDHPEKPAQLLRPHVPGHEGIYNFPNYMPDGKSILFMAASEGKNGYDYDVYRLDLGTGAIERLTKGNSYATDLRVFADGKTAVFLKWRSDSHATPVSSELYLLDIQSHNVSPLKVSGLE